MKISSFGFVTLIFIIVLFSQANNNFAYAKNAIVYYYSVFTRDGEFLIDKENVAVGDCIITTKFEMWEIYFVDNTKFVAKADFVKKIKPPFVTQNEIPNLQSGEVLGRVGMYLTHNAESYITGDGVDSIYGKGGVHDIAKLLKANFEKRNVQVVLDETLHLPHDSKAYSRSASTAKNVLSKNVDAIFDIHRDGASRSAYITNYNGQNYSKVMIVVGKANANYAKNLEFALYLMSVAEHKCPWLFNSIYMASGHYNQALSNKALLFEMGTYTIEKSLVEKSVPYLADVICDTLFETTVDKDDNLNVGGDDKNPTVDDFLDRKDDIKKGITKMWGGTLAFLKGVIDVIYTMGK